MQEIIERYIAAWNETDPARLRVRVRGGRGGGASWARGRSGGGSR